MAEFIKEPMRKGIKTMAKVAHTANAISQMPQPQVFALMITSDVIYMSAKVQEVVHKLDNLLDAYSDIPFDFLSDQFNGIMNTATSVINKVDFYAKDSINSVTTFANNAVAMPNELVNTSIDMYASTSSAVIGVTKNLEMTASAIAGKDNAAEIKDELKDFVDNINESSSTAKKKATDSLKKATDKISNAEAEALGYVSNITEKASEPLLNFQDKVNDLLTKIRKSVDEFSESVDKSFGVSLSQKTKALETLETLSSLDTTSGDEYDNLASTLVSEASIALGGICSSFSIGKMVTACGGLATNILLVQTGLSKLPPINIDKMLSCINGVENKLVKSNIELDDLVQYNPSEYEKYKRKYDEELQSQRNAIRKKMAEKNKTVSKVQELKAERTAKKNFLNGITDTEKKEIKSAIKEIRKVRKKARKARKANKLKSTILLELKKFYDEVRNILNIVKTKWNGMMNNYRKSIAEIKSYFTEKGSGSAVIDKICDDINQNCSDIKKLCTQDLPTQLTNVSINVVMPRALGLCFPNFAQHIVQFFADIKIIIKFIMDLIRYVMNIIKDVNELVRIIMNGINNAKEIYKNLMEFLNLEWLINLVTSIQEKFNGVMASTVEALENTLEPVYFEDTDDYENMMDAVDSLIDQELPDGCQTVKSLYNTIYSYVSGNNNLTSSLEKVLSSSTANSIYNGSADEDDIEKLTDKLDEMGNTIVAYRSPFFKRDANHEYLNANADGEVFEPVLEGYRYYHPDLYHYSISSFGVFGKMRRRRKSRFIKKAARRSGRKNGGVNMIKKKSKLFYNRKSHSNVSAWDAFYWYTVMTDNVEVDFLGTDNTQKVISKVVFNTSNGSVVLIDLGNGNTQKVFVKDANVKSGDYVNYNGQKYKIM